MTQLDAGAHLGAAGRRQPVAAARADRWALAGGRTLLVLHAVRRHRWLFLVLWTSVIGLSLGGAAVLPRKYEVQATIQAQRTQVMSSLVGRPSTSELEASIRQAEDTILRQENLVSIIRKTDLIARWKAHRAPVVRWKDAIVGRLFRPPSEKDLLDGFLKALETRLWVKHTESTVTIGARLPDPDLAMDVVSAAVQSFLDARSVAEIDAIGDVIGILESRAVDAHGTLERSLSELERLRGARAAKLGRQLPPTSRGSGLAPVVDPETERLIEQVQVKQQAIADLEDFRRRRTTELQSRLEEERALYTDPHPAVLDLHQSLEEMKSESPQLQLLKRELHPLEQELRRRGFAGVALPSSRTTEAVLRATALEAADPREDEDPDIEYQKAAVRQGLARYNEMLGRVETARLEQDSARAAFKYRYLVIRPVERPKGPVWPKLPLVALAGAVGGLAVALLGAALLDLGSGRILEPWQVELQARVQLLGELDAL
ncbi:MAG TPA: hypothetical protein VMT11_09000 [Myxococcaceae bacterium]|nr:hypothetical protein [Myxococcaceae bacterium]